ncbi:MAG: radical SAM protein [Oscillospiraceae bacterium]|nr:radical SAM protein [Oscillospiraceae bacterium]
MIILWGVFEIAIKDKLTKAAADTMLSGVLKYIDKNPEENIVKILDYSEVLFKKVFPPDNLEKFKAGAADPENTYTILAKNALKDIDRATVRHLILSFGLETVLKGTKTVRENREKYGCNIPFTILFDPTSACNLKCRGCWSSEYGHSQNLSLDEMLDIVKQGKAMGTHNYMLTGGEPLIRKKDVLAVCGQNPDCTFLVYTNATLVDEALCDEMNSVKNITLALSIEGTEISNDFRRGGGSYKTTLEAMDLLKKKKCLFGISVCYTRENIPEVTSDSFLDLMVEKGAKYAFYFNYMPLGSTADENLIPLPEQREFMYKWLRRVRAANGGKSIFIMDFQDDAEYVGGCIAGGRNYFHINSAGDIEPCVFIHYSDSNIRTHTLLEALQNPLFQAYRKGQPFNDNHLRPCPMLENPDLLREIIKETGAKSTNLLQEEDVETLCAKCDKFARAWKPEADRIWAETKHPETFTQYYRDNGESKRQ